MNHQSQPSSLRFAQDTRNSLRISQAKTTSMLRIDKTVHELLLEITWRIAEKLSGDKLPR